MAGINFVMSGDNSQLMQALNQSKRAMGQFEDSVKDSGQSLDDFLNKAKTFAASAGITLGATELTKQVVQIRGQFQQLEIAFTTMLGSADKANALMQQLTTTAAKTPFDLQGIAGAAKQLLAYGTEAEEVNDILIHLGDIAAGLSIPLEDLVYVYGTTMVQGKMFTADLKQLQGRGVPILEALAKEFNTTKEAVSEFVSQGKITSDVFKRAMMSMSSEGGKFAGLMEAQSSSFIGQMSNIQDSIDMMFNEIGQSSEGMINLGLKGVSKLVENYKEVGKAVAYIAGTYGTYRAALVVVAAVERAHMNMLRAAVLEKKLAAGANIMLSNSDAIAAAKKAFFTKTIKLNTQAILKNTAAMLTNPAVLITAGIVALVASVVALTRALNTQARAQESVNRANEKQKEYIDGIKSQSDEAISTIQSETATVYEKAKAYELLKKIMPELTEKYTQEELAVLDLTKAQKDQAAALEEMNFEAKRNQIEAVRKRIEDLNASMEFARKSGENTLGYGIDITKAENELKILEEEYKAMVELRKKAEEEAAFNALSSEEKIAQLQKKRAEYEEKYNEYQGKKDLGWISNAELADMAWYEKQLKEIDAQISAIQKSSDKSNPEDLKRAQKELLDLKKAERAEEAAYAKALSDRQQRDLKYLHDTAALAEERAKYNQENGATETSEKMFEKRQRVIDIEYQLDTERFEREFAELEKEMQSAMSSIGKDMNTSALEFELDIATSYNEKLEKRKELREAERKEILKNNQLEMENTLRDKYGDDVFNAVQGGQTSFQVKGTDSEGNAFEKTMEISPDIIAEIERAIALYQQLGDEQIRQYNQSAAIEDYQTDIQDYTSYVEEMIELARWRKEQIDGINSGELTGATVNDVDKAYQSQKKAKAEKYGIDQGESEATEIAENLSSGLVNVTLSQLSSIADTFVAEIDKKITDKRNDLQTTQEEIATQESTISSSQDILQSETASEDEKAIAQQNIATAQSSLNALKERELQLTVEIAKLTQTRESGEAKIALAQQNATKVSEKTAKSTVNKWDMAAEALYLANDACRELSDSLGDGLTKDGKKAMNVVTTITSFATQNIGNIQTLVSVASKGMEASGTAAAASLSAAEKASVILTIISLAVQAISAIVNLVGQFSKSAQMQEAIDEGIEKVDELKEKNEELQRQYEDKSGTRYFVGMAQAAKDYNRILREQEKVIRDSQALYNHQVNNHGADSKKAEEAGEQLSEQEQILRDMQDEQKEMYRELAEELLTTDLSSFASDLADSMVDGFANGMDGIGEVFDAKLDDLMRDMMKKGLQIAFENLFSGVWDNMSRMTEDGELTQSEMDAILAQMEAKSQQAKDIAETYYQGMSERGLLDDASVEGSEGKIAGMSQESADALEGKFTALQIEGANVVAAANAMLELLNQFGASNAQKISLLDSIVSQATLATQIAYDQLDELRTIALNTSALTETNLRLKAIQQNTDRL